MDFTFIPCYSGAVVRREATTEIARVIGTTTSTVKDETLEGVRLLLVEIDGVREVVADTVSAGPGVDVYIVRGTAARLALGNPNAACDATTAGIVDEFNSTNS